MTGLNNKKIIITGASGFVGTNLTKFLEEKKHSVQPLSLRAPQWKENINQSANAIIHLAGKAHDTSNTSDAKEYFEVNTELTKELFNLFLKSKMSDFFYFSSVKAVADSVEGVLIENVVGKPITPYGQSKLKAEEYILSQSLPTRKRVFIIRPCMIHGPGNKGNLNLLYSVVKRGIPWPLAAYDNERSFLSIENLNYLINEMLNNKTIKSGVYNFADDDTLSTNELVSLIALASGKKPRLWNINMNLINRLAKVGDKIKFPLNTERLDKLTDNYRVGNAKIKQALGIEKLPVSIEDGIVKTIKSFTER